MRNTTRSIVDLLNEYEIRIPVIQREYVQGSDDKSIQAIREHLLKDIVEALDSDGIKLSLGIIYGITDRTIFYPLDGQQRLTTLFLLYWFMAVKLNQSLSGIKFTYEIRHSANSFFRVLLDEAKTEQFQKLLNQKDKLSFVRAIKNQQWFKTQWFNDVTVLSLLNTLGEIIELNIKENKLTSYFKKLTQYENCPVFFYFLPDQDSVDPYRNSSKNYIRMNARGKLLESFENIKARLEIIERNLLNDREAYDKTTLFTWKYDSIYIDLFYDRVPSKLSLEEKTKRINTETLNLLINLYNIAVFTSDNNIATLAQAVDKDDFNRVVYHCSRDGFGTEDTKEFWKSYFRMLHSMLETVSNDHSILTYVEELISSIRAYENMRENNNIIAAYVKYMYYYFVAHSKCVTFEQMKQLEYVLENLHYGQWKVKKFIVNDQIIKDMAQAEDIYAYFVAINHLQTKEDRKLKAEIYGINDIFVRFKEQSIKFKIINELNQYRGEVQPYPITYFEKLESKHEKRAIHYLLVISNLWNEKITYEKLSLLLSYMKVAELIFHNDQHQLIWRKILAIVSNLNNATLASSDEINSNVNHNRINGFNHWYWENDYYYLYDDNDLNSDEIFQSKMQLVKRAYGFILSNQIVNDNNETNALDSNQFIAWCRDYFKR